MSAAGPAAVGEASREAASGVVGETVSGAVGEAVSGAVGEAVNEAVSETRLGAAQAHGQEPAR